MPNPLAKYGNPSHPRNDRSKSPYVAPPFAPVQLGIPTGARSSVTSSRIQASTPTLLDAGRGYAVANSPPPHRESGLAAGAPRPASTAHCCSMAAAMGESFRACAGTAPTRFTAEVEVNSFEFDVGTTSFEWSGNTCPCRWARNGDLVETAAGVCGRGEGSWGTIGAGSADADAQFGLDCVPPTAPSEEAQRPSDRGGCTCGCRCHDDDGCPLVRAYRDTSHQREVSASVLFCSTTAVVMDANTTHHLRL